MEFASSDITGTRWSSPCGEYIDTVLAVTCVGTKHETLTMGRECAFTGESIGGVQFRKYHELDAYTPALTKESK